MTKEGDSLNVQTSESATITEDGDLLEHHILYISQHDAHTLQEHIDDVGVDMDRLTVPAPSSLQGEAQVNLKIEIGPCQREVKRGHTCAAYS